MFRLLLPLATLIGLAYAAPHFGAWLTGQMIAAGHMPADPYERAMTEIAQ